MVTCDICGKQFKNANALNGHLRVHGASNGVSRAAVILVRMIAGREYHGTMRRLDNIEKYWEAPNFCQNCNDPIDYDVGNKKYCSRSCSVTATNTKRPAKSNEEKNKISRSVSQSYKDRGHIYKIREKSIGYNNTCKHCGVKFTTDLNHQRYCDKHAGMYKSSGRNRYAFTFNVFDYPELFDLELVKKRGWHSHGGRYEYNPDGLTRDHKVSVNESIRNGYEPFYIKHPLNCEIMTFEQNNKKKTKSSLLYKDLVSRVNAYEGNKMASQVGLEPTSLSASD